MLNTFVSQQDRKIIFANFWGKEASSLDKFTNEWPKISLLVTYLSVSWALRIHSFVPLPDKGLQV